MQIGFPTAPASLRPHCGRRPGSYADPERFGDPAARLRAGLADLYRFFRAGAGMLTCIYRDLAALAEAHQQGLRGRDTYFRDILTAPLGDAAGDQHRRLGRVA